ncbi:MAG: carboxypeptidase-like regulatory domain-containing protein, partial [Candidatus Eisenbacteria bacterium]
MSSRPARQGVAWIALALALATPAVAQQKPEIPSSAPAPATGRIVGRVIERGKDPVAFANVIVLGGRQGTMTDDDGNFVLDR